MENKVVSINKGEVVVAIQEGDVAVVLTEGDVAVNVEIKNGKVIILALREDEDGNWKEIGKILAEEEVKEKAIPELAFRITKRKKR